jgi:IS6 family transposase
MRCQRCAKERFVKAGRDRAGRQIYQCGACGRRQTERSTSAFRGYRFPDDLIALAVRWYLRFRLPYADIVELLAERGVHVDPSSVYDWVQHFTPLYKEEAARPHRHRVGTRWAVDETYIRLAGRWVYAYRAIDEHGQVIDVYLSETRDTAAATAFFAQAIARTDVRPRRVTTGKAAAYPPALRAVVPEVEHVTGKMEQQGIERDHQHLKGRTRSMRGFQQLRCAQVVCDGHGFMRTLHDGFYRLGESTDDPRTPQAPRLARAWDDLTQILAAA